jgi:hypothetical protein
MPKVIGKELPDLNSDDPGDTSSLYREFVLLKKNIDDLTKRQDAIKKELSAFVEANGLEDDKGHKWFDMDEYQGYVGMQRQRRVSQKIDEQACHDLILSKGLSARCYELKPVLDQEEVIKCVHEGLISEDELDEMFPKTVTSAFILLKK